MTLFTTYDETTTLHRSGPPPRTRDFLREHFVKDHPQKSAQGVSLRKFRVLEGDLTN